MDVKILQTIDNLITSSMRVRDDRDLLIHLVLINLNLN